MPTKFDLEAGLGRAPADLTIKKTPVRFIGYGRATPVFLGISEACNKTVTYMLPGHFGRRYSVEISKSPVQRGSDNFVGREP